jgi:hypothetical protein
LVVFRLRTRKTKWRKVQRLPAEDPTLVDRRAGSHCANTTAVTRTGFCNKKRKYHLEKYQLVAKQRVSKTYAKAYSTITGSNVTQNFFKTRIRVMTLQ